MRTLTSSECSSWIHASDARTVGQYEILFERPTDGHVQAQLARFLVDWLEPFEATLLWLTDWPFYEPDEMALVSGLRRAHGDQRALIESPGHVFDRSEAAELAGWLSLTVRFGWDGQVIPRPFRGDAFNTSHHDTIQVWSATVERFNVAREAVQFFGLQVVRETPAA